MIMRTRAMILWLASASAACGGTAAHSAAAPQTAVQAPAKQAPNASHEQPIPAELREQIERSCRVGRILYTFDKAAAIGTDVLLAHVKDPSAHGLAGYLPMPDMDSAGNVSAFVDRFFDRSTPPRVLYEVRIEADVEPKFKAFEPPQAASPELSQLIHARQLALDAIPAVTQPLNPLVLPGTLNGENGLLVYLLAGTKTPGVAVFGRHYRALVSGDGAHLEYLKPLSKSVLEVPVQAPSGEKVESLIVTQLVTDYPLETHVFTSLLMKLPVLVETSRGTWLVNGDEIKFYGKLRDLAQAPADAQRDSSTNQRGS